MDINWPNYDTVKLYTFSPQLRVKYRIRLIILFPCCAIPILSVTTVTVGGGGGGGGGGGDM